MPTDLRKQTNMFHLCDEYVERKTRRKKLMRERTKTLETEKIHCECFSKFHFFRLLIITFISSCDNLDENSREKNVVVAHADFYKQYNLIQCYTLVENIELSILL